MLCIPAGKRRYNIKLWKTFTDCFNCLPIAAIIDEKIFTMHGGLSPDLQSMEQIRRVMRPTDVPDTGAPYIKHVYPAGLLCWLCFVRHVFLRVTLWLAMVRSRQRHYRMVRKRPGRVVHLWARCCIKIPTETRYGFDLSSTSSKFLFVYSAALPCISVLFSRESDTRPLIGFLWFFLWYLCLAENAGSSN